MAENKTKPLYRRLNEVRTQGEWKVTEGKHTYGSDTFDKGEQWFNVNNEDGVIADFLHGRCLDTDEKEARANAQYTALAVNNFAQLAQTLEWILNLSMEQYLDSETVANKIKEALNNSK